MKKAVDDMFIPVMPRILDPSLKFDEESIISSLEKSKIDFQKSKNVNTDVVIDIPKESSDVDNSNKKSFITIIAKYKIHILVILGVILLCGLIYYFYKQYKKNNKKDKSLENKTSETVSSEAAIASTNPVDADIETKETKENSVSAISNYLSNYIDVASESDSSSVIENVEIEELDSIVPPTLIPIDEETNSIMSSEDNVRFENLDFESDSEDKLEEETEKVNIIYKDEEKEEASVEDTLLQEAHDPVDIFNKYNK